MGSPVTTNADILVAAARMLDGAHTVGSAGSVTFRGARLASYNTLYSAIGVPGILCRDLVAAETSTEVDTQLNRDFLGQVKSLWKNRLSKTAYFTVDQVAMVLALLEIGVYVAPVNARTIQNVDPNHPLDLVEPGVLTAKPATRDGWDSICKEFKTLTGVYLNRQQAEATARGAELEANVAFWDEVYKEALDAVKAVASGFLFGFGSIAGVVLIVAGLYLFGPRLIAAAKASKAVPNA